ncbi:DUF320 domain-containing protein [Streptomyces dangxiongensis]|uniref:DUF320 domain-containing protein n=1 Tax=Streptomyces dangxiongensis TaxID=1442032 RepID=A0A3G2JKA3_9ACTN|nr:DUF320 domain-containing protein [Streptomyces dangxiongensis]
MFAVAAASGAMAVALPVSAAFAADGAGAQGTAAGSPGLISGNTVQLPVHVPVNVCGNTVNVVGLLNPAAGNTCANERTGTRKETAAAGGASAQGAATDSPGVISGNGLQLPVHVPVNISGNSVDVVGVGNPATGNRSVNGPGDRVRRPPHTPAPEHRTPKPPAAPRAHHPAPNTPRPVASSLAHTGADMTAPAVAGSAALVLTGVILYRRFRPGGTG